MYRAPLEDIRFVLRELLGTGGLRSLAPFQEYSDEIAAEVLQEAARFAEDVLAPLNHSGDVEGAHWSPAGVRMPVGFKAAYEQFVAGGWPRLGVDPEQGMPGVLASAVQELWASANLAFKLCPMLTQAAAEALQRVGSPQQRSVYLPRLLSGEWTGTMNLTEPQAGSDLSQVRMRAVPHGDHYRLFGQKIFITYGDHDLSENVVHMVLARIEGAPDGIQGISLFIVPKFVPKEDGRPGAANDIRCVSIERKLGIHASPTCVLAYGDQQGAQAWLVGEDNRGIEYMFLMMNTARLSVGLEGYAMAERAFQQAAQWARTRVQGRARSAPKAGTSAIIYHPDVKRMLLTMKSWTQAMRALGLYTAQLLDIGKHHADPRQRDSAAARAELLIPIVKGWCTESGIEIASLGIQVHGGMGFIEETGAAQLLRDVRITAIYEGTTGIQANDLVGRKLARDGGAAMDALIGQMLSDLGQLPSAAAARAAVEDLRAATRHVIGDLASAPDRALAGSVPYLHLAGYATAGWLMARSAQLATRTGSDAEFRASKQQSARCYADLLLPRTGALARQVQSGAASVLEADPALI